MIQGNSKIKIPPVASSGYRQTTADLSQQGVAYKGQFCPPVLLLEYYFSLLIAVIWLIKITMAGGFTQKNFAKRSAELGTYFMQQITDCLPKKRTIG